MIISRLRLKNWRNFRSIDVRLRERVFVIGPNASGKSNLLDALRFLRDVAKPGGSLQVAVADRNGMTKLRCLHARRDPEVLIEIELSERADDPPKWRYSLGFQSEGKGLQRVIVSKEEVQDLARGGKPVVARPDAWDAGDRERLTETSLEQVNANKEFREIAQFLGSLTYLHLLPQLLKHPELGSSRQVEGDPFGQTFLERIAATTDRTRASRLRRIESALRACVPHMRNLRFQHDDATGRPHLEAMYEHWRPDAGWQREDQLSDGTLRLLGIMWSLLDGDSLLLMEEPELSLNESIVTQISPLIWKMQRQAKHRRQVFVTTHSEALLSHPSIDPREVLRLEPSPDGTKALAASEEEMRMVEAGYSVAEAMATKVRPKDFQQISLF